ncbi:MAG: tryptophan--tRNA ligase, partial [Betaproteobacteria bacterium]
GEHFVLPQALIEESVATLPGLDGRKMSKSYDNSIPLFAPRAQLQKLIAGIVTDSRAPGQAKDTEGSALYQIYQAFASGAETSELAQAYADGISWADAKQLLFERIDREIAPMRELYQALIDDPQRIETILLEGAAKARSLSAPFVTRLRHAVGLRRLSGAADRAEQAKPAKAQPPAFKQYRERDGKFYFKLVQARGGVLLQSTGFDSPKEAAQAISALLDRGGAALAELAGKLTLAGDASEADIAQALQLLAKPIL